MDMKTSRLRLVILFLLGSVLCSPQAFAQDFFKGKSIMMYSGYVGGGVDNELRLAARFIGKHIVGNPNVAATSMPGANGMILANYLFNIAKPDGLSFGIPGRGGYILAGMTGDNSAKFELSKFNYIGSSGSNNEILWLRKGLGIRSADELLKVKEPVVVGGIGATTATVNEPMILAKYKILPLRVVPGYPGTNELVVALERGEIDGFVNVAQVIPPNVIASGEIVPIAQAVPLRPGLPTFDSLIKDERQKAVMRLPVAAEGAGAPMLAPPGMPEEARDVLRKAYAEMVASAEYQAAAATMLIDVSKPLLGKELQEFVNANMTGISPETIKDYAAIAGAN
jgi:tripartite-type tricarboxylate transporter receptor subunit TctC